MNKFIKRRQDFVDAHPKITEEHKKIILNGGIYFGMIAAELVASRGEPKTINKAVIDEETREQWYYKATLTNWRGTYVYFLDGMVITWGISQ